MDSIQHVHESGENLDATSCQSSSGIISSGGSKQLKSLVVGSAQLGFTERGAVCSSALQKKEKPSGSRMLTEIGILSFTDEPLPLVGDVAEARCNCP